MRTFAWISVIGALYFLKGMGEAKKLRVPCPNNDTGCIKCSCKHEDNFNSCTPLKQCPKYPTSLEKYVPPKMGQSCPFGTEFKAECLICECGGEADHCAICFALPVKRPGAQPDLVNEKLPYMQHNKFYNYEVNGWEPTSSESKESSEGN